MRISGGIGGPPPGLMGDDDDDDDQGVPPEILDMIRMTEMMARGGSIGGMPPGLQLRRIGGPPKPKEDNTPRHEEPIEDIMARMNKLSDEIGDRHEKGSGRHHDTKSQRVVQLVVGAGVVMMIMLVSFIMTCRANA